MHTHHSSSDVLVALLLLGGVELNPGPTASTRSKPRNALSLVVLNIRSAWRKAALIHDVIDDYRLDALAKTRHGYCRMHLMPSSLTSVHPAIRSYTVTEERQVTSAAEAWHRSHQVGTWRSDRRYSCHLANGTETVALQPQGRLRWRSLCSTSLYVLLVLHQQSETHSGQHHQGQHLDGIAVVSASHVCRPSASRTKTVLIWASDHCASHCQTRQPVTADWKVSGTIQESAGAAIAEESRAWQLSQRTTGRSPTYRPCPRSSRDSCWHAYGPTCSALPTSANSSLHTEKDIPRRLHYWSPRRSTHGGRRQASYCNDRPRPVGGLRQCWPPVSPWSPADWVRSGKDTIQLAAVRSWRPDPIRQDGTAPITCCRSRLCAWVYVVCGLLQPDRRRHRLPQRTISSIRRRHAASSHHARRQQTNRAVCSHPVYHWRQTVVPAVQNDL